VDELAAIAANPQLRQLADNPKVTTNQVFDVIAGVARSALPDLAQNFLRTVIDNGRVQALPEIAAQFRALVNRSNGSSDAVVYSAFPLDAQALADLGTTLQKRFGRKLNLSVQQDETLIGGVRVVVGDEVLDTSVKARLEQMKAALTA
jgi:F-type H+-transporting ATPase subunit delta